MLSPEYIPVISGNGGSPPLNLTEEEFISAVEHQPRPLVRTPMPGAAHPADLTPHHLLRPPGPGWVPPRIDGGEREDRPLLLPREGPGPHHHLRREGGNGGRREGAVPLHRPFSRGRERDRRARISPAEVSFHEPEGTKVLRRDGRLPWLRGHPRPRP